MRSQKRKNIKNLLSFVENTHYKRKKTARYNQRNLAVVQMLNVKQEKKNISKSSYLLSKILIKRAKNCKVLKVLKQKRTKKSIKTHCLQLQISELLS